MAEPHNDESLADLLSQWQSQANKRPLRILVGGKTGAGKSALINNLLGAKLCQEGFGYDAVSTKVNKVETELNGVRIEIFDTPGLEDMSGRTEESIMVEMSDAVGDQASNELDLFFYCKAVTERGTRDDVKILGVLTRTFGDKLWERGIIVLTQANRVDPKDKPNYPVQIERFGEKLKSVLSKQLQVEEAIVNDIPVLTAGYTEPVIPCESDADDSLVDGDVALITEPNWKTRLFLAALERSDPKSVPSLMEISLSSVWRGTKDLTRVEAGVATVGGFVAGGFVALGTAILRHGSPDTKLTAGTAALTTLVGGTFIGGTKDIRRLLWLKYEKWKLQRSKKND